MSHRREEILPAWTDEARVNAQQSVWGRANRRGAGPTASSPEERPEESEGEMSVTASRNMEPACDGLIHASPLYTYKHKSQKWFYNAEVKVTRTKHDPY